MFQLRSIATAVIATGLLAGCAGTTSLDNAPLTDNLNVVSVVVETDEFAGVTGRNFSRSDARIAADIKAATEKALSANSDPAGLPVEVRVDVKEIALSNAADRAVAQASLVRADLTVRGEDNRIVVPTQEVTGTTEGLSLVGAFGALTTPGVEKDYSDTVAGFAATLNTLLFPQQ